MTQETMDEAISAGVAHHRDGRLKEAEAIYRQVLASFPNNPNVLRLLGLVLSADGQVDAAVAMMHRAIHINPANPLLHSNLGSVYRAHGRIDEAIETLKKALEIKPDYGEAYTNLGNALRAGGRLDEAVAAHRQAVRLKPELAVVHFNLGKVLIEIGEVDQAVAAFREAIRLQPDYAKAYENLADALYNQGSLDEGIQSLQKAVFLAPDNPVAHRFLLFAITHHPNSDETAIHRESCCWSLRHAVPVAGIAGPFPNDVSPNRRLKIAYISKFFCDGAELHYLLPLLARHDHRRFEVFFYSDSLPEDEFTAQMRVLSDQWCGIVGRSDTQVADLIREHRIDIVVHIAPSDRLLVMARKPAPLLVTWLFSAASTGLDAMDYRVSDPYIDPVDRDDSCSTERTLRLPETAWCYDPLIDGLPVNPLPAIQNGHITFGSLNRLWKINDAVLTAWSKVLKAVASSHLYLLAPQGVARRRVLDSFASLDIKPERIIFVSRQSRREYLQTYHHIDVALDTFPYNGHTTSLDALWMGVPVVSLAHRRPVGRVGASILGNLGLTELVAETPEAFVSIATRLAQDRPNLIALRAGLRERMEASPLMDAARFARNMESAYLRIWRKWRRTRSVKG